MDSITIEKLYSKYSFIFNKEEYNTFISKVSNNIKDDDTCAKLDICINEYLKEIFRNEDKFLEIVSKYIRNNIVFKNDYRYCLKEISKLIKFLDNVEFLPSSNLLVELIEKNDILRNILNVIVDNGYTLNNSNVLLSSLIDAYYIVNNYQETNGDLDIDVDDIYFKSIGTSLLSREEEKELACQIKQGDKEAFNIFIEKNLTFVVSIAKAYIGLGLPFLDLIQEGNIGLINAVKKYDFNKGYKFSTFSFFSIKNAIIQALNKYSRTVTIPPKVYKNLKKFMNVRLTLKASLNREPTIEEIATSMNIDVTEANILSSLQYGTVSFDYSIDDEEDSTIELMSDNLEDCVTSELLSEEVFDLLKKCNLSKIEFEVLYLSHGLCYTKEWSLANIGRLLHLTRERVRQIEAGALRKIIESPYIDDFAIYMDNPSKCLETLENCRILYKDEKNKNKKLSLSVKTNN